VSCFLDLYAGNVHAGLDDVARSRLILLIYESHSIRSTNCMHAALADLLLEIIMVRGMV